jgi:hypothetical protein
VEGAQQALSSDVEEGRERLVQSGEVNSNTLVSDSFGRHISSRMEKKG